MNVPSTPLSVWLKSHQNIPVLAQLIQDRVGKHFLGAFRSGYLASVSGGSSKSPYNPDPKITRTGRMATSYRAAFHKFWEAGYSAHRNQSQLSFLDN